jgi:hypothetical protein
MTTELVRRLLDEGRSQSEISKLLNISKPSVCYHARKLGVPPDGRFRCLYDWNDIQAVYDTGMSVRQCAARFGFNLATWHKAVERGDVEPRPRAVPVDDFFSSGRRRSRGHVKKRLFSAGIKERRCEHCGLSEWMGDPIGLELHHVNGDGLDNRLENLEILCGNCHARTPNWGGRKPKAA